MSTPVLEAGDGQPVLILHGVGQFAAAWMRVLPNLMAAHRVVLPDLPAQGASQTADDRVDADRVLGWLGELIEQTCSSPPALVGHQAGGAIAARFAADHRDRIDHLVLMDSFGLGPFRPTPQFALAMVGFLTRPTEQTRDRFLSQCMVDLEGVHAQMGEGWELIAAYALDRARTPSVKTAARRLMKEFGVSAIPEADLSRIAAPTTLIWGRHNREARLRLAEAASERYGWPLRVIDDCGADANLEQPDALVEALHTALSAR